MHHQCTTRKSPNTSANTARIISCRRTLPLMVKAVMVALLLWLLAWCPTLATVLGRLVLRLGLYWQRVYS
jgi:hypothetical protein